MITSPEEDVMAAPGLAADDIGTDPLAVDVNGIDEPEQGGDTDPENPRNVALMDAFPSEESVSPLQEESVGRQGEPQNPQNAEAMGVLPYEESDPCLQEGAVGGQPGQDDDTDLQYPHPQSVPSPDGLPSESMEREPPGTLLYDPVYSQLSSMPRDSTLDGPEADNLLIGAPGGTLFSM